MTGVQTCALPIYSLWHPESGEANARYYPDHAQSTKTRAEVLAELEAARQDGTLFLIQRNASLPDRQAGPGRSRAEVVAEVEALRQSGQLERIRGGYGR